MPDDLHACLVAELGARLEVARAATERPWVLTSGDGTMAILDAPHPDWPGLPEDDVRRVEALLRVVELAAEANAIDDALNAETGVGSRDLKTDPRIGDQIIRVLAAGEGIEVGDG